MVTLGDLKLNQIFAIWPPHMVATTSWFNSHGINSHRVKHYVKVGWIKRLGPRAFVKTGEPVLWSAAVQALQQQQELEVHVGGESALELDGIYDQLPQSSRQDLFLYGKQNHKLPRWMYTAPLGVRPIYSKIELFNENPSHTFREVSKDSFIIRVSSRERAILELLHEVPLKRDLSSMKNIFFQLTTLRHAVVQNHLEKCNSIKIKRLFMYLSRETHQPWYKDLDKTKINLGAGKRVIEKNGKLDSEFLITVTSE